MSEVVAPETGMLQVAGGQLYYEVAGTGPALVLIHADVADHRMWDDQFAAFARRFRVIRYDKRGFGRTTAADGAFSPRQDLADLLKHLGVEQTCVLGLSNGGQLAIDLTLERPGLVSGLIAVAAGVSGHQPSATEAEMQLINAYIALQEQQDIAGLVELGVRAWADGPGQPEGRADVPVREHLRAMLANNYHSHHEHLQPSGLEPPAIARLAEIHVPTLVIVGDLDFSGTIAAMALLAQQVASARKVIFPGVAHMVNMEQPERFNTAVLTFLERL
jgi:pimeloyl-ACP methyl ester carboxylesterase